MDLVYDDEREPELHELDELRYLARRLGRRRMAVRAELAAKPKCGGGGAPELLRLVSKPTATA